MDVRATVRTRAQDELKEDVELFPLCARRLELMVTEKVCNRS